jgi:hypothetical protein
MSLLLAESEILKNLIRHLKCEHDTIFHSLRAEEDSRLVERKIIIVLQTSNRSGDAPLSMRESLGIPPLNLKNTD